MGSNPILFVTVSAQEIYQFGRLFALGAEGWEFEPLFLDLFMLLILYYVSFTAVLGLVFFSGCSVTHMRRSALASSLATFFVSLLLGPFLLEGGLLLSPVSFWFSSSVLFGLDGASYLFVLLSVFLTILCILVSWFSVVFLVHEFLLCLLILQFLLIILFTA